MFVLEQEMAFSTLPRRLLSFNGNHAKSPVNFPDTTDSIATAAERKMVNAAAAGGNGGQPFIACRVPQATRYSLALEASATKPSEI